MFTCAHTGQFDRGGPFQSPGQQQFNQQPPGDPRYGYDRRDSQGQYDQQRYPQQYAQDQRWDQRQPMGGPGRDDNQYGNQPVYQNVPVSRAQYGRNQYGGGGAQYQFGGTPYGGDEATFAQYERNQGPYDDRRQMYNQQQPGMNQGQNRGMQYEPAQQGYQRGGPPDRGVQDVPHKPREAWGDRQDFSTQPFNISTFCCNSM